MTSENAGLKKELEHNNVGHAFDLACANEKAKDQAKEKTELEEKTVNMQADLQQAREKQVMLLSAILLLSRAYILLVELIFKAGMFTYLNGSNSNRFESKL